MLEVSCAGVCLVTREKNTAAEGLISTQRSRTGRGFFPWREVEAMLQEESRDQPRQCCAQARFSVDDAACSDQDSKR